MIKDIRHTLKSGKASIGSWLNLGSPLAAEVMAAAGFDWLVVDAEHTSYSMENISNMFRAIEARGAIPLARAWDHSSSTAGRLLDAGAYGIVFPHVSTPEQAKHLADSVRYPPIGSRSAGTGRCTTILNNYRNIFNDLVLCIPQIEDMEGINNAEAIARVEGVDIGFLGPNDLALSMDVPVGHPEHEKALRSFRLGCKTASIPCGIPVRDAQTANSRIEEGFQFIDINNDLRFLESVAMNQLKEIRK
jgi:2-keto-3-deoxy-L-rhamnonate aldolase RhmA